VETVNRVVDVLEVFLASQKVMGTNDVAKHTGHNVSTIYRILSILKKRGHLIQLKKRGKYYLGPRLLLHNQVIRMSGEVKELARPFLLQLSSQVRESVNLAILDGNNAMYIDHIEEANYRLRLFTQVGNRVPLYCTGVGKIFLANMSDDELESYMNNENLISYTPNTINTTEHLKKEIELVRSETVAISREEFERGVKCIAAPLTIIPGYVIASISISGPSARIDGDIEKSYKSAVKNCAIKISPDLRYLLE